MTSRIMIQLVTTLTISAIGVFSTAQESRQQGRLVGIDLMDTRNFRLRDYRRMFMCGTTPNASDLKGYWRGVNKGIATMVGYRQFIKEIQPCGAVYFGDNIQVHQVSAACLRCIGWQPKFDADGSIKRHGKFAVQQPDHRGPFGHGVVFSYRDGGNRTSDPARLIVDKVVKIDENHLLGRAVARIGLVQVPLAYFMLERAD